MTRRRCIDPDGMGQSGYMAGRTCDPALERQAQVHAVTVPGGDEDEVLRTHAIIDDRFLGRGGATPKLDDEKEHDGDDDDDRDDGDVDDDDHDEA